MGQCLLFFDGVCNLCNGFVDFLIRRDHDQKILFAPLQGKTALEKLPAHNREKLSSVILLLPSGQILTQSDAALYALQLLPRPWCWFGVLRCVPKGLRDWIYDLVARRRYKIFGQRQTCRIPSAAEKARFLD